MLPATVSTLRMCSRGGLVALVLLAALAGAALVYALKTGVPIRLNALRAPLAAAASRALDREVEILGELRVAPALWPTFGLNDVRVGNPPGFRGDYFVRIRETRGQLDLLALLRGDVRIGAVAIEGARVALETTPDGRNNWALGPEHIETTPASAGEDIPLGIASLTARDVHVFYREGSSGSEYGSVVDELTGSLSDVSLALEFEGSLGDQPYALRLRTDRIRKIAIGDEPWDLEIAGRIAGVPISGTSRIEATETSTRFELTLQAERCEIGDLIERTTALTGIEGGFGRLEVRGSAEGSDLHDWASTAAFRLTLADGAFSAEDARGKHPVSFRLDEAMLELMPGEALEGHARGKVLDMPARLSFKAGDAVSLLDGLPWPIELDAAGAGASLRLSGLINALGAEGVAHQLRLELKGARLGDLAPWLRVPAEAPDAYELIGDLLAEPGRLALSSLSLGLGRTRATGELAWLRRDQGPLLRARVLFSELYPRDLARNLAGGSHGRATAGDSGIALDKPIVPSWLSIPDAEIEARADRIQLSPTDLEGVSLTARVRKGRVRSAPFRARYADVDLRGELDLDLRGGVLEAGLRLRTGAVDLVRLGRAMGLTTNFDARAERLSLDLRLRGRSARELLTGSEFVAVAEEGVWSIRHDLVGTSLGIRRAVLRAERGQPIVADAAADLKGLPVALTFEWAPLLDIAVTGHIVPVRVRVESSGARLELEARDDLSFRLAGEALSDLDPLLGVALPPLGPYAAEGVLRSEEHESYRAALELRVRDSLLGGTAALDTSGAKPYANLQLQAKTLQLRDFAYGNWTPTRVPTPGAQENAALSPTILGRFDADATLNLGDVRVGSDSLGRADLRVRLRDGRLAIEGLELDLPGGEASMELTVEPRPSEVLASIRAHVERFDYGIVVRHRDPQNQAKGRISLGLDLESRAPDYASLAARASGWIGVAAWPEEIGSKEVLELWAVNVLTAVLGVLPPLAKSRLNCAVGIFDMQEGLLESRTILVDSSRMQLQGSGYADLDGRRLRFEFVPRPKHGLGASVVTPLVVEGTLRDFRAQFKPELRLRTVLGQARSVVRAFAERLLRRSLPSDGSALCEELLRQAAAAAAPNNPPASSQ